MSEDRSNDRYHLMEAYPRSTIWPYALVVLVLFLLTATGPHLWREWEAARGPRQRSTARDHQPQKLHPQSLVSARSQGPEEPRPPSISPDRLVKHGSSAAQPPTVTDASLATRPQEVLKVHPPSVAPRQAADEPPPSLRVIVAPADVTEPDVVMEVTEPAGAAQPPALTQPINHVDLQAAEAGRSGAEQGEANGDQSPDWASRDLDELAATLPADTAPSTPDADELPALRPVWPRAETLLTLLDTLPTSTGSEVASWQIVVRASLEQLSHLNALDAPEVDRQLSRLSELSGQIPSLESKLDGADQVVLRRIGHGINRRVALWGAVHRLATAKPSAPTVVTSDALSELAAVERQLAAAPATADTWRAYLALDKLNEIATATWVTDPKVRRSAARIVLDRLESSELTAEQRGYVQTLPLRGLTRKLHDWAYEPIDASSLVHVLEKYESLRSGALASQVIDIREALRWNPSPAADQLQQTLDTHYRNANIRVAISGELINDLLPVLRPIQEQIRDNILGAEVLGQNRTWTDLKISLVEDDRHIRLRFEAAGQTRSRTVSIKGPIRFYNTGQSRFMAGKDLMVTREGIFVRRATAVADGQAKLIDIQTDYDGIPLLGWLLRQVAIDGHEEQRGVVRREFRQRVSRIAEQRLNESVHERLTDVEQKLDEKVIGPLRRLKLDPQALEMRTTADRIVLRSRIAESSQLAACTPRPRALQDSALSLQVHDSAANNLLQQLELEGRRIDMEELMVCLSEKLRIDRADIHQDLPPNAVVRLGYDRPIEVEFDNDRVLVTIRIAELSTGKKTWHNFVVRGRYRADVTHLSVDLSREGGIELISEELGFRDQIALRGIFTKVMTRNHRLNLIRDRFAENRRLANLIVSQFVVRDGWIGVSISPLRRDRVAAEDLPSHTR